MQRQLTFGGGVSPRGTLLRGQSIIEYVLIIAVIGLVIVFAGPGVAGAIRNQFNLVGNTVNNGTTGGTEGGGASGGGSAGADSATVQAAIAKDAKDWTLDEQKAVAADIAAKGEASPAYAKAEAAMKAETKWSVKLTNGRAMTYRIVGINHDDLADGSGKAGLTFMASAASFGEIENFGGKKNDRRDHIGDWEKSELRQRLNSGDLWNLFPLDLKGDIKAVTKATGQEDAEVSTVDKVFLISGIEMYNMWGGGGYQYEYWSSKGYTGNNYSYDSVYIEPLFCL